MTIPILKSIKNVLVKKICIENVYIFIFILHYDGNHSRHVENSIFDVFVITKISGVYFSDLIRICHQCLNFAQYFFLEKFVGRLRSDNHCSNSSFDQLIGLPVGSSMFVLFVIIFCIGLYIHICRSSTAIKFSLTSPLNV